MPTYLFTGYPDNPEAAVMAFDSTEPWQPGTTRDLDDDQASALAENPYFEDTAAGKGARTSSPKTRGRQDRATPPDSSKTAPSSPATPSEGAESSDPPSDAPSESPPDDPAQPAKQPEKG